MIELINNENDIIKNKNYTNIWLLLNIYNQECFDAICLLPNDTLRVIHITNNESHNYKLQNLIPFITILKVKYLDFVVICRQKNLQNYKITESNLMNITILNDALKVNHMELETTFQLSIKTIRCLSYENPNKQFYY